MQVTDVFTADERRHRVRYIGLVEAEPCRFLPINDQHPTLRDGLAAIVYVDDAGSLLEHCPDITRDRQLPGIVDAIDLRHQRRQYRRTRWDFDDLDICAMGLADALQRLAQRLRNFMTVTLAQ